jgi:protein involved in polysaccharide export with SLBB domain
MADHPVAGAGGFDLAAARKQVFLSRRNRGRTIELAEKIRTLALRA